MNKIIISLLLLLASISFSQVNTVYHDGTDCNCDSIHQVYNDNGKLASEAPYVNGLINGVEKGYYNGIGNGHYESGSILRETPYVNGLINGVENRYYEDGTLAWETPYKNGKKNGVGNRYHDDGTLKSTAKYKNGVLDGYKHCSDGRMGNESLNCR